MRYATIILFVAIMGCSVDTKPATVAGPIAKPVGAQIQQLAILKATVTWTFNDSTYEGMVILNILDGRDTVALIERGTLTNLHGCTAGGFSQALFNAVKAKFDDLGIPDTSSNCIESEWQ